MNKQWYSIKCYNRKTTLNTLNQLNGLGLNSSDIKLSTINGPSFEHTIIYYLSSVEFTFNI